MSRLLKYKRVYLLILIPISLLLMVAARMSSFLAEQIYAKYIYKFLSQVLSTITGVLPFSLAEILVILLPAVVLAIGVRFVIAMFIEKGRRKERLAKAILNVLCTLSVILFSFMMCGGLNYYRYSFSTYSNLEIENSSVQELYALTESLAKDANELRQQINSMNSSGVYKLSMSYNRLAKLADKAFDSLGEEYPILRGSYGAPKPVLLSKLMSQTEITGIFIPFTMEANVNVDIPDYNIPFTMLHELAHLHGFMREDEANYLAYLAGMKSDNIELNYSSTMLALVTAGNALYDKNPDLFFKIADQYTKGVQLDFADNSDYWTQFEDTVVSTVSNKINDTYLKANNQSDGIQSYGRMLDLLLAKYRLEHAKDIEN